MGRYSKYFTENDALNSECFQQNSEKFKVAKNSCFLNDLRKYFDLPDSGLTCRYYESVILGEGNEKEKIDSVYSSSLQSFLFFHKVGQNNTSIKIHFDSNTSEVFNEVYFEYKNKVIGYPSSIDVVLVNREDKSICFVESKLLEIIRDSIDKDKSINKNDYEVVGISYFLRNGKGFSKLNLKKNDWEDIGITLNIEGKKSDYLEEVRGKGYGDQEIRQIGNNSFVYPYGIKQILSHLIGINNFFSENKKDHCYTQENDPIKHHNDFKNVYYIELFNELPGFDEYDNKADKKLNDFITHFKKVKEIVCEKNKNIKMFIKTYQDLYKDNPSLTNDKIKKFYHLDKKNENLKHLEGH